MSRLIIEEPPLQVLPSLALAVGLNEAIVLQQLHYLLRNPKFGRRIAEEQWIFNTIEQWQCDYFPFWSARTIKTIFASLKSMNLILTCQPEGNQSRRQYYRINEAELSLLSEGATSALSTGQELHDRTGKIRPFLTTKTSSETTAKTSKGSFGKEHGGILLRPYPESEESMIETLEENGIEHSPDYDGRFFETMTRAGWKIRGKPVFDWVATYAARLEISDPRKISRG